MAKKKKQNNYASFEKTLFKAADKLRKNMDSGQMVTNIEWLKDQLILNSITEDI